MKKVFVSGSFDLFHSGHVAFLETASKYGELYVGIGTDVSIEYLKERKTVYLQEERLFIIREIRYVKDANINTGVGYLDFTENPFFLDCDIIIVNEDQDFPRKRELCERMGKEYIVLERKPAKGLPRRSSTSIRELL
jgi:cytidyltransferase-like protein